MTRDQQPSQSESAPDVYALRRAVGQWLRIKAANPYSMGQKSATDALVASGAAAMYRQIAADAEHSDLLVRLLNGERPREAA